LQQQLLETLGQNTQAVSSNTQTKASAASDALQTAGGALGGIVAGSILTPIVSGLMSLFGNGGSTTAPVLPGFTLPAPVQIQTVVNGGPGAQPALIQPAAAASAPQTARGGEAQVQVQVNAMDARSFLDHSDEIADAVRRALLSSHALGDVIAEL
jgi:hypothetical protein